jgi:predicted branched-subunit amino acid permease
MKNQVARTYFLLGMALILFASAALFVSPGKIQDILNGASAGFGLAGCVSFIMLLVENFKQRKA